MFRETFQNTTWKKIIKIKGACLKILFSLSVISICFSIQIFRIFFTVQCVLDSFSSSFLNFLQGCFKSPRKYNICSVIAATSGIRSVSRDHFRVTRLATRNEVEILGEDGKGNSATERAPKTNPRAKQHETSGKKSTSTGRVSVSCDVVLTAMKNRRHPWYYNENL